MATQTTNLGKVLIIPKGEWSALTTYSKLDLVTVSSQSSYVSKADNNLNHAVTDTAYWQVVANVDEAIENAATATTQANTARDGANSAAQSATNLVNSYAMDLAAKELKANKQNSLTPDGTGTKFPTVDAVNAGLGAKANKVQEGWITPTLLNGWVESDSSRALKYFKDNFGIVRIRGSIMSGTDGVVFTLPLGYRPKIEVTYFGVYNANTSMIYACRVRANGNVEITAADKTHISLDQVTFPAF